jgi:hypothetical protein
MSRMQPGSLIPSPNGLPALSGSGDPNGVTSGAIGQIYIDTDTNTPYINGDGGTTWSEVGAGGGLAVLTGANNPNAGAGTAPAGIGQIYIDTTNEISYINVDNTATGWRAATT